MRAVLFGCTGPVVTLGYRCLRVQLGAGFGELPTHCECKIPPGCSRCLCRLLCSLGNLKVCCSAFSGRTCGAWRVLI